MFRSGFFEIGEWLVRPVGGLCEVTAIATDPERSRVVDHRLVGVSVCEVKSCDSRHVDKVREPPRPKGEPLRLPRRTPLLHLGISAGPFQTFAHTSLAGSVSPVSGRVGGRHHQDTDDAVGADVPVTFRAARPMFHSSLPNVVAQARN